MDGVVLRNWRRYLISAHAGHKIIKWSARPANKNICFVTLLHLANETLRQNIHQWLSLTLQAQITNYCRVWDLIIAYETYLGKADRESRIWEQISITNESSPGKGATWTQLGWLRADCVPWRRTRDEVTLNNQSLLCNPKHVFTWSMNPKCTVYVHRP